MNTPKFLIADNSEFPDDLFILHTEYPRFLLNVDTEEVDWWDDVENDQDSDESELTSLVEEAFNFLETEMDSYEEEDDEDDE